MARKNKPKKIKERGVWLDIWLIIIMLHSLLVVFLVLVTAKDPSLVAGYPVLVSFLLISAVARFVGAIAIWRWEKWGLYVYAGGVLVSMIVGLLLTGSMLLVFNDILPLAILGWLLRDKWDNFE